MPFNIRVSMHGQDAVLRAIKRTTALPKDKKVLHGIGVALVDGVREQFRKKRTPEGKQWKNVRRWGQTARRPLRIWDDLYNSFTFKVRGDQVIVSSDDPAASLHNFGKRGHRASRAKYLAIPLKAQYYRQSPLDYGDAFVLATKRGHAFIVQKVGKGRLNFMYILKKRVDIPARKFFGISRDTHAKLQRVIGMRFEEIWGE